MSMEGLFSFLKPTRIRSVPHNMLSRFFFSTSLTTLASYTKIASIEFQTNVLIESMRLSYSFSLPSGEASAGAGLVVAQNAGGVFVPSTSTTTGNPGVIFWENFFTVNASSQRESSKTVPHYFYPYHYFPQGSTLDIHALKQTDGTDLRGTLFVDYIIVNNGQDFVQV